MDVVQLFPNGSALEIAKQLRNMADAIDAKEMQPEAVVCVVFEPDTTIPPNVYGFGHVPSYHDAIGKLHDAADHLLTGRRVEQQEE